MEKDFDSWNASKKGINQRTSSPFYHAREIWWCSLGINVGFEQDGSGDEFRRPVLILKGFGRHTCLVVPLTKSDKAHPLRPSIGLVDGTEAHALLSQIRVLDTKRLVRKIGRLDQAIFSNIQKAVRDLLTA